MTNVLASAVPSKRYAAPTSGPSAVARKGAPTTTSLPRPATENPKLDSPGAGLSSVARGAPLAPSKRPTAPAPPAPPGAPTRTSAPAAATDAPKAAADRRLRNTASSVPPERR